MTPKEIEDRLRRVESFGFVFWPCVCAVAWAVVTVAWLAAHGDLCARIDDHRMCVVVQRVEK